MSFPNAADVRRKAKGQGYIEDFIRDIMALIKDDILSASERCANEAVTELPTDFNIPTMKPEQAQRHIYYFVAKQLEQRGFIPTFSQSGKNTENQKWWIRTRWFTENDEQARIYMDQYIKSRTEYTEPSRDQEVAVGRRRPKKSRNERMRSKKDKNVIVNSSNDLQDIIILN